MEILMKLLMLMSGWQVVIMDINITSLYLPLT